MTCTGTSKHVVPVDCSGKMCHSPLSLSLSLLPCMYSTHRPREALSSLASSLLALILFSNPFRYHCCTVIDNVTDACSMPLWAELVCWDMHHSKCLSALTPRLRCISVLVVSVTSCFAALQLMLSKFENDGKLNPSFKTGPFQLPLAKIWGYPKEPQSPRFVLVSSAGVTRPNRYCTPATAPAFRSAQYLAPCNDCAVCHLSAEMMVTTVDDTISSATHICCSLL